MKFEISFYRDWREQGTAEIEADSEEEARDLAREMLAEDSCNINWKGENMEILQEDVERVSEV